MSVTRESRKTILIMWGALLWSLFLFVYLVYTRAADLDAALVNEAFLPGGQSHAVFVVMSTTILVMAFVMPRFMFRQNTSRQGTLPTVRMLFVPWVARMALAESIALLGFILGQQAGNLRVAIPFFGLTLLIYALHFPSESNVAKWLESRRF